MKQWKAYVALLCAMIIWSTATICTKVELGVFQPLTLITLRFTLAIIFMAIIGLASHSLLPIKAKDIPIFLLGGIFQPFLYFIFETYGIRLLDSPSIAEALLSTSPLFAPLFAWLIIKEKVTLYNLLGILVSTVGVLVILLSGNQSFSMGSPLGVLFAFAAVISAVLYTIVLRKIPLGYNSLSIVFYVQLASLLFFYPVWAIMDSHTVCTLCSFSFANLLHPLLSVGYLAIFPSVLSFVLFCWAVRQIGVTRANVFNNSRPVFTAILMALLFGEHMPLIKWIGILIIIFGLCLSQYQGRGRSDV